MGPVKALCYCPSGPCRARLVRGLSEAQQCLCRKVATTAVEGEITAVAMSSQQRLLAVGTTAKKATLFSVPDFEWHQRNWLLMTSTRDAPWQEKALPWSFVESEDEWSCVGGMVGGRCLEELANFQLDSTVRGLSFSPDGSMLAGGGGTDKTNGLMTKKGEDSEMKTVVWQVSSQAF
eukprot:5764243-Amphidinium_carterae.1